MNMLRSIREKKGLTIGQLAARASIPTRILAEYEEGRQTIPLPHAKLIAKALWVRIEELMPPGGTAPSPGQPAASPPTPRPEYRPQPGPQQQAPANIPPPPDARPAYTPSVPPPQPPAYPARDMQGQTSVSQGAPLPQTEPRSNRFGDSGPQSQTPRPAVGGAAGVKRVSDGRGARPPRPTAPPPKTIGEGQLEELLRLGLRLEMEQAQLEDRIGKPLAALTRTEGKDWIKRFRDMLEEASPTGRVAFGQWPGSREDREASYLGEQREAGATLDFKLFNGEQFRGKLIDFTPYTITLKLDSGEELVLRKLSIVYYRRPSSALDTGHLDAANTNAHDTARLDTGPLSDIEPSREAANDDAATAQASSEELDQPVSEAAPHTPATAAASTGARKKRAKAGERHQPLDAGVDSDRADGPDAPEKDNMDEDRGL